MKYAILFTIFSFLTVFYTFSQNISERISLESYTAELEEFEGLEGHKNYRLCIKDNSDTIVVKSESFLSAPGAELEWLGENYVAVYGGSFYAADCFCIISDGSTGRMSEKIYRPICVDIKTETIVSVDTEKIIVLKIFDTKLKKKITLPDDMLPVVDCWHGLKRNSTKIIDGILYVCYVTDSDARGNYVFEKIKSVPLSAEFGGYFSVKTNVSATGIESKSHFKYLLYALFIFILGMFVIAFILYSRIQNKKKANSSLS